MYSTSTRWKENIYQNKQTYINIYIDDVLINSKYLYDFKKGGALFDNDFILGGTPSQYIELKLKKGIVTNPKKIRLEFGMFYNDYWYTVDEIHNITVAAMNNVFIKNLTPNYETIPIGEYIVDDYNEEDKNIIIIKALDNMIKFDSDDGYCDLSEVIGENGATHLEIAQYICDLKGVELGSTSFLNDDQREYVYDNEIKAREYISYIAECAGGFAIIGRDGKLYFRTIYQDEDTISINKFKTYKIGEEYKITQVVYENGIEDFSFGDTTRNTLWLNPNNLFMTEEIEVQNIYNAIKDITINSFSGTTFIDPAIDIGDKLIIGDLSILYQGDIRYQKRWITDISSVISIKAKEETTVRKVSQKTINRRVQSRIDEEAGRITLLAEQQTEDENRMSQIELDIDGITTEVHRDYSTTEQMNTAIGTAKNEAIAQAGTDTDSKLEDYSTTVQMNSAINQKANEINLSVSQNYSTKAETNNAINSINIGARNLQLGSSDWDNTAWTNKSGVTINGEVATIDFGVLPVCTAIPVQPGDELTVSVDIKSSVAFTDTNGLVLDFLNSSKSRVTNKAWQPIPVGTEWTRISTTFIVPSNNQIKYFAFGPRSRGTEKSDFRHLKVEVGNKATDWTPAPEDEKNYTDTQMVTTQQTLNTQIQQTTNSIMSAVGETYSKKSDLESLEYNVNTKFTQTKEDFLYEFNNITQSISDLSDATTEQLNTISKYIRFVDGNIVLGETGNELTLQIANDRISFLQSAQEVAYFSNNKLYVTDGEFLNSLTLGNFSFIPRTNGNLSFRKTGGA